MPSALNYIYRGVIWYEDVICGGLYYKHICSLCSVCKQELSYYKVVYICWETKLVLLKEYDLYRISFDKVKKNAM